MQFIAFAAVETSNDRPLSKDKQVFLGARSETMDKDHICLIKIIPEMERQRLDKALTQLIAQEVLVLSRVRVQGLIAEGMVSFAGKPVYDVNRKVKSGEVYKLQIPPPEVATPQAQIIPLKIIYEDKDLLVIDKPAGMVVHPAPGNRDKTLVNALLAHCKDSLSGIGGVMRPGIVHRLDKDTSGLMVVAKNDKAHQALTAQFSDRSLNRTYQAIVWGSPKVLKSSIDAPIGRHPRDRKKMAVTGRGKPALTHYRVLEDFKNVTLMECKLATGRTHQIRVHFAHMKHPLVGDPAYGKKKNSQSDKMITELQTFPRQALHAVKLEFIHPTSGKTMRFASELPKDVEKLLKKLRKMNS